MLFYIIIKLFRKTTQPSFTSFFQDNSYFYELIRNQDNDDKTGICYE